MMTRFLSCPAPSTGVGVLLLALVLSSPAGGQVTPVSDASRYGVVDDHILSSVASLQRVRDAGFGWVEYLLYWNFSNPTRNVDCNADGTIDATDDCNFDWSLPDAEIQRLADLGLNVYVRLSTPPTWTTGATHPNSALLYCFAPSPGGGNDPHVSQDDNVRQDDPDNCSNPERRPGFRQAYSPASYPASYDRSGDLRIFVEAAVRRYRDRVRAWGFGAEIHSRVFWQGSTGQFFDEVLRPGYETVKKVDPSLVVVGPDEDREDSFEALVMLESLRGVRAFDVLSFHVLRHSNWADIARVDERLAPLVARLRDGRPFWVTELGHMGGNALVDGIAAGWLQEMLAGIAARPWIDKTFVYRLKDDSEDDFGLLDLGASPKPAYTLAQQFLATQDTPRRYYLAEGATKGFFDLDVLIANPNDEPAPVKISFMKPDGSVVLQTPTLAPRSRKTIRVDDVAGLENTDVSTVVESTSGLPLAVERTMFWDSGGYGGHTDTAVQAPATRWYFAEGSQGFFDTYVLLANSNIVPAHVTVTFMLEGLDPVEKSMTVGATSRGGFCACEFSELSDRSFGILVASDQPIIAERAMYFGRNPFWTAGHESAGVTTPSTSWFLAEGRTGPFFDEYVLISNPNDDDAFVDVRFLTSGGDVVDFPAGPLADGVIPGKQRFTIYVDAIPGLEDIAVSTSVSSDLPVVVERAMYWPGTPGQWYEAHNSFGVTETGHRWALAEGRTGTSRGFETYILLVNTGPVKANVTVTYLLADGTPFSVLEEVPANSRTDIVGDDPRLANREYGAVIESDQPIAVERALYWTGSPGRPWGWGGSNATAVRLP